jgi:PHD/YefM family antitoxin component YafN of YafNO toxin-antitoxin module
MAKKDINKKEELKQKLYKLIDSIEDEHTLNVLHEDVVPYLIENKTKELDDAEDDLTEDQLKELDEAIAEADRGDTISYEDFKKNMDEWRTRLKSTGDLK